MIESPHVQLINVGVIAAGMILVGTSALLAINVKGLALGWGTGLPLVAYLYPGADSDRIDRLVRHLWSRPEVNRVHYVAPNQARKHLADSLGQQSYLLDGLEDDFLPGSLEIGVQAGIGRDELEPILALLASSGLVAETSYLGAWARSLGQVAALIRTLGIVLGTLIVLICLYVMFATMRLTIHAHREEIETQRLLGATERFIRLPFLIQGLIQGLVGTALAIGALYVLFLHLAPQVQRDLIGLSSFSRLNFLAPSQLGISAIAGIVLGLVGNRLAWARQPGPE
jgi:cell division transport system permease protein